MPENEHASSTFMRPAIAIASDSIRRAADERNLGLHAIAQATPTSFHLQGLKYDTNNWQMYSFVSFVAQPPIYHVNYVQRAQGIE
jgi:hypothetical protein